MVMLNHDICEYYAWFIRRRYHLTLYPPLRGGHVSFISDHVEDLNWRKGTTEEKLELWKNVVEKYDGQHIQVMLNTDVRTDGHHWWLNIPEEHRTELHTLRNELGLSRPYYGLHMSIGKPNDKNIMHSQRLHAMFKKYD